MLARQLGMKSLPAGTFLHLDEERVVMFLCREMSSVRVTLQSTISGQMVISQNVIPPEGRFEVNYLVQAFKEETLDFVGEYFKENEGSEERIVDLDEALNDMKRLLIDISKTKRRQTL